MLMATNLCGFGAGEAGLQNSYALQFTSSARRLDRTFGAGTRTKFALSVWIKTPASFSGADTILNSGGGSGDIFRIGAGGVIDWFLNNAASGRQITTAALSTSTYYHLLFHFDSNNGTAGDRMRLWRDGTEVTSFSTDTNPGAGATSSSLNNSAAVRVGQNTASADPLGNNTLLDEIAFFDNNLPAVTSLRDPSTGKPMDLSGLSFGTTGFWLRFEGGTAAAVGTDSSGLSNTWTGTSIVDGDLVATVP